MILQQQISRCTRGHGELVDLTGDIADIVLHSGIQTGMVNIFVIGSTAALGAIELEPGLLHDFPSILDQLMPPNPHYKHEQAWHDGNGHSHLQATLQGPSLTVPFSQGKLLLGTWQQLSLIECDIKPRTRTLVVTVYGE